VGWWGGARPLVGRAGGRSVMGGVLGVAAALAWWLYGTAGINNESVEYLINPRRGEATI
jgi:hypothetical protein